MLQSMMLSQGQTYYSGTGSFYIKVILYDSMTEAYSISISHILSSYDWMFQRPIYIPYIEFI